MADELKTAILDAKYIDLIDLAGSLIAEFGEDPSAAAELAGPQQQALAAAVFRWAASDIDETIAASMGPRPGKALVEAREAQASPGAGQQTGSARDTLPADRPAQGGNVTAFDTDPAGPSGPSGTTGHTP